MTIFCQLILHLFSLESLEVCQMNVSICTQDLIHNHFEDHNPPSANIFLKPLSKPFFLTALSS